MPQVLRSIAAALVFLAPLGLPGAEGDEVYHLTAHGDVQSGVQRDLSMAPGSCRQCHAAHGVTGEAELLGLFAAPDNVLCFTCHQSAGAAGVYRGEASFLATDHWASGLMLWPGPEPAARASGDEGLCLNCHTPHGSADALGVVPVLGYVREEALCLACHDGSGPSPDDLARQLVKRGAHPVQSVTGLHTATEGLDPTRFAAGRRHAECVDCHNPHGAADGSPLALVSRLGVTYSAALTAPSFTPRLPGDPAPMREAELCYKCHSSWTTLPAGRRDIAFELNPLNGSFHPVQSAGKNTRPAMTASLLGGTGTPHLTTASVVTCSDCHGSEALPTNVTLVSTYAGLEPTGPHGSNAAPDANYSNAVLRARYRVQLKPAAPSNDYARSDFQLCFICHSPAPFEDTSRNPRADTDFRYHGFHLNRIFDQGSVAGPITTPGAGTGNAICAECHYSIHGAAGAGRPSERGRTRLVVFSPNVTGTTTGSDPAWSTGQCTLRCHGKGHNPKSY